MINGAAAAEREVRLEEKKMLWTIIVILFVLWALGIGVGGLGAGGGLIHLLIVVAIVIFVIQLISGRRAV